MNGPSGTSSYVKGKWTSARGRCWRSGLSLCTTLCVNAYPDLAQEAKGRECGRCGRYGISACRKLCGNSYTAAENCGRVAERESEGRRMEGSARRWLIFAISKVQDNARRPEWMKEMAWMACGGTGTGRMQRRARQIQPAQGTPITHATSGHGRLGHHPCHVVHIVAYSTCGNLTHACEDTTWSECCRPHCHTSWVIDGDGWTPTKPLHQPSPSTTRVRRGPDGRGRRGAAPPAPAAATAAQCGRQRATEEKGRVGFRHGRNGHTPAHGAASPPPECARTDAC